MRIADIEKVLNEVGLANHFGDDTDAQTLWLIEALKHAMAMYDTARSCVFQLSKEWAEIEAEG